MPRNLQGTAFLASWAVTHEAQSASLVLKGHSLMPDVLIFLSVDPGRLERVSEAYFLSLFPLGIPKQTNSQIFQCQVSFSLAQGLLGAGNLKDF